MDDNEIEKELKELMKEFDKTLEPQYTKRLAEITQQAKNSRKQIKQSLEKLQELLDYLRVCIKYQVFDLEATRRENEYLRKLLEEEDR